jgi:MFS family permease
MSSFQPSDTLKSRTFIGLLVAQFLAAFNDQAIHASAMFFAINQQSLTEAEAISLMPILFYAPWAIFCTVAGYLADRYSKRQSLVFWKMAEIVITLVALAGFWLGTQGNRLGPYIVLSTVFLMGTHSAFFVPAKYGVMPEILQPHLLSKGNGLLESLSFLAVILGTVCGGILSFLFLGREYVIGEILLGLALIGAVASLLIHKMPAANPGRAFPPYLYQPLFNNLRILARSRPLAFAIVGIAFFTFIVAFMRATVYMHGESRIPRWTEFHTSVVVGVVALGIGLGSPLAGFFSGGKVELGLVPLGALGMIAGTLIAALALDVLPALIVCIVLIGFFTGFYIVPLFTLLQHRAPKASKGDSIATSNFINVTGAIIASLLFFILVFAAHHTGIAPPIAQRDRWAEGELLRLDYDQHGRPVYFEVSEPGIFGVRRGKPNTAGKEYEPDYEQYLFWEEEPADTGQKQVIEIGRGVQAGRSVKPDGKEIEGTASIIIISTYTIHSVTHYRVRLADQPLATVYNNEGLPRYLFIGAGLITLLTLVMLRRQLPDLFLRSLVWLRSLGRYRLRVVGIHNLPTDGPVILTTNCRQPESCLQVLGAVDRYARFLLPEDAAHERLSPLMCFLTQRTSLLVWRNSGDSQAWDEMVTQAVQVLAQGGVLGLPARSDNPGMDLDRLLCELQVRVPATVLPVFCSSEVQTVPAASPSSRAPRVQVVIGAAMPPTTPAELLSREIHRLGDGSEEVLRDGVAATTSRIPRASAASPKRPAESPPASPSPG